MEIPLSIETRLHDLAEGIAFLQQPAEPTAEQWRRSKIIAHRGLHAHPRIWENTLSAFEPVLSYDFIDGLEFDVRWTRDVQPVVFHDATTQRIFGRPDRIAELTLAEVQQQFPLIPTLAEVIARFGGRKHLMIELKEERYPDPPAQARHLQTLLAHLEPTQDFHFLLLRPETYDKVSVFPRESVMLVGAFNVPDISEITLQQGFGGIGAQYLLLSRERVQRHLERGQVVGTGYPAHRSALFRELSRGVEWIFSNRAADLALIKQQEQLRLAHHL
jgi:glycerophosphoryl diester phosphodiesterase